MWMNPFDIEDKWSDDRGYFNCIFSINFLKQLKFGESNSNKQTRVERERRNILVDQTRIW